eukprot:scaffold648045_cov35-Prasinocladus_malaysianus.AAC.1
MFSAASHVTPSSATFAGVDRGPRKSQSAQRDARRGRCGSPAVLPPIENRSAHCDGSKIKCRILQQGT